MRESSEGEKTRLPGDTYEEWLGTQTVQPAKVRSRDMNKPAPYEVWIEKRVQTEIQRSRAKVKHESRTPKRKVRK
ncbi:MAG: hypothetical protein OK452_07560 [Thaumarchaeota archaeon]|nr:hypothetical protein [Nitrososphaerota archaeon]